MRGPVDSFVRSIVVLLLLPLSISRSYAQESDVSWLMGALLGKTPLDQDLQSLTDEIGGRATGSEANLRAVEWALQRFKEAGVNTQKEAFTMPMLWLEQSATAEITGDVNFTPRVVAMPFSAATPPAGVTASLIFGGSGSEKELQDLGSNVKGSFLLIVTHELLDLDGLFKEYYDASSIEQRAFAAGVTGIVYMSSRPHDLLYRHNVSVGKDNTRPMLIMEREEAMRAMRLLQKGKRLTLTAKITLKTGGPYESHNVIAEIRGAEKPDEFVLIGAHLDSWDLGTGANDNGCNIALVIDVARQMKRLGLRPKRTIRFTLFNGEEQGMNGSFGYTLTHATELDRHVMASSYDIGSGRINGFFTNGRAELLPAVDNALRPVEGLGPFANINEPIVGTDNYDFMMQGVANLVANQESANYGPNYHARSDTYDKVDIRQVKLNAAIAAAVTYAFANMDVTWGRQNRAHIEQLVNTTTLRDQMAAFGVAGSSLRQSWEDGTRGRK